MPADHGLGLDDDQCFAPSGPEALEKHPENAVCRPHARAGFLELENGDLLTEGHVLEREIAS